MLFRIDRGEGRKGVNDHICNFGRKHVINLKLKVNRLTVKISQCLIFVREGEKEK